MELSVLLPILIIGAFILSSAIKILQEYERGVVFRLGRLVGVRGPGLVLIIPIIDRLQKVSLRIITMDIPPQDVITKDNVSVKINAVVYFRVVDPGKAIVSVENFIYATSQLAQTTLRSVCGEVELDEILAHREKINTTIQEILDRTTESWGVKISAVEIKHIDLPQEMQRAMARQAEAERERRAKITLAEAEFQAAQKLKEAADTLAQNPITVQLRFLQTVSELATEKTATLVLPVPIELFRFISQIQKTDEKKA
ncbi:MAG: slipin family protein [Candidatus Calescibacterium sp.]|nr:slipin family protein [Candidatus Calescibacterium sp.]MCX7734001.1 slipin family protein [bacterium]MDW8086400.1 slipin family protein [Candidatus Calescibacterium sp.]